MSRRGPSIGSPASSSVPEVLENQTGQQLEKRTLAAPAWSYHRDEFASIDSQIERFECSDMLAVTGLIDLGQAAAEDRRLWCRGRPYVRRPTRSSARLSLAL